MPTKPRPPRKPPAPDLVQRAADELAAFLPKQRWFGGKGRGIQAVRIRDHAVLPGGSGELALFEVTYQEGGTETYFIPVAPAGAGGWADAADPAFAVALGEAIRRGVSLQGQHGEFRCVSTAAFGEILPEPGQEAVRVPAEHSNTALILDRRGMLKLFRRLEPGPNPDCEILDLLTRFTSFREAPRLAGSIVYQGPEAEATTLAVLQEYVPSQGNAWDAALARLAEYYAAADEQPAFARTLAAADATEAQRLGALTGRMHMALASPTLPPVFRPEPIGPGEVAAWLAGMQGQVDRAFGLLRQALPALDPTVQPLAQQVIEDANAILQVLDALRALETEPVAKLRVHGDYHLGQILRTGDGFMVLDFEGEPTRPLAERRSKQSALKDVAGMLRSFAYAAEAALAAAADLHPGDLDVRRRLAPSAEAWEEGVRTGFLRGYLAETWERGAAFLPRARATLEAVLRVFETDKAVYELHYEMTHRPEWIRIPLEGLVRTAATTAPARPRRGLREGPFRFTACLELREFVGVRAENERQLAERMEEVSLDAIYYHTHAFFLRHRFLAGIFPNDFATWVASQVRDEVLGERLAMVDPAAFGNLQDLREELIAVIDDHLRSLQVIPGILFGEPFDFIQSRIVEIPTAREVRTLPEFREALLEVDVSAIYFHLVEARLRLGRGRNDFAAWLEQGLGLPELAARVQGVDPYAGSLERTRMRLIQLCDETLAGGAR